MIRDGIDRDPLASELIATVPRPLLVRLSPEAAAGAIERRSPRVVKPGRWVPISALRGLLAPALDARSLRDRRALDVLAQLDRR